MQSAEQSNTAITLIMRLQKEVAFKDKIITSQAVELAKLREQVGKGTMDRVQVSVICGMVSIVGFAVGFVVCDLWHVMLT